MKWRLSKDLSGKTELAESWQRQTGFRSEWQWHVTHLKKHHEDTVIAPVTGSGVSVHTLLGVPRIDNTAGGRGTNRRFHEVRFSVLGTQVCEAHDAGAKRVAAFCLMPCNSRCQCHAYQISVYTIILTRKPWIQENLICMAPQFICAIKLIQRDLRDLAHRLCLHVCVWVYFPDGEGRRIFYHNDSNDLFSFNLFIYL